MAFENSPNFNDPSETRPATFKDRLYQNRRKWIIAGILFTVVWVLGLAALFLLTSNMLKPPGGAEGYLVTNTGQPAQAVVTIDTITQHTYDDGYFFFPELPPGEYELIIETNYGIWREPVTIISGQAVDMGKIVLQR
ncbi:MAG: carboxypeptidase-like regulatory domain-containing protein [Anaerolineaceae bacterium]|nr:carboxypeptidase-like regulatory domain-containing protein [Anaerolineaceae bacterium]